MSQCMGSSPYVMSKFRKANSFELSSDYRNHTCYIGTTQFTVAWEGLHCLLSSKCMRA